VPGTPEILLYLNDGILRKRYEGKGDLMAALSKFVDEDVATVVFAAASPITVPWRATTSPIRT